MVENKHVVDAWGEAQENLFITNMNNIISSTSTIAVLKIAGVIPVCCFLHFSAQDHSNILLKAIPCISLVLSLPSLHWIVYSIAGLT